MPRRRLPPGANSPTDKHYDSGKSLPGRSLNYIPRVRTPTPEPELSSSLEDTESRSRTTATDDELISTAIPTTSSRTNTPEKVTYSEILWRNPISERESGPPITPELPQPNFGNVSTDYELISSIASPAAEYIPESDNSFMDAWKCIKGAASPSPGLLPFDFYSDLPPLELPPSDSELNIPLIPGSQPFESKPSLSLPELRPGSNTIHPPELVLPPPGKHLRASSLYDDVGYRQIRAVRKELHVEYIMMIVGVSQSVPIRQSNINGGALARPFSYLFHDLERRNLPQCNLPFPKPNNFWLPEGASREEHNTFMLLFWSTLFTYSKSLKWWYKQLEKRMLLTQADRAALQNPVLKTIDEADYMQTMYSRIYGSLQKIREDDINDFHDAKDEILPLVLSVFETDGFEKLHSLNYENLLSGKERVDLAHLCSRIQGLAHLCFLLNHQFMEPVRRQIYEPIIEMHTDYSIKEIADHIMGVNAQAQNDLPMEHGPASVSGIQNTGIEKRTEIKVEGNLSMENVAAPRKFFGSLDSRKQLNQSTLPATTEDVTASARCTQSTASKKPTIRVKKHLLGDIANTPNASNASSHTQRTVTHNNKNMRSLEKQRNNLGP